MRKAHLDPVMGGTAPVGVRTRDLDRSVNEDEGEGWSLGIAPAACLRTVLHCPCPSACVHPPPCSKAPETAGELQCASGEQDASHGAKQALVNPSPLRATPATYWATSGGSSSMEAVTGMMPSAGASKGLSAAVSGQRPRACISRRSPPPVFGRPERDLLIGVTGLA